MYDAVEARAPRDGVSLSNPGAYHFDDRPI